MYISTVSAKLNKQACYEFSTVFALNLHHCWIRWSADITGNDRVFFWHSLRNIQNFSWSQPAAALWCTQLLLLWYICIHAMNGHHQHNLHKANYVLRKCGLFNFIIAKRVWNHSNSKNEIWNVSCSSWNVTIYSLQNAGEWILILLRKIEACAIIISSYIVE